MKRSAVVTGVLAVAAVCSGCAAAKSNAPPSAEPAPHGEAAPTTPSTSSTSKQPAAPNGGGASATNRSMALQSASREIEASQRELDVAGSDCRNACRALGSMDRAAGRLCALSQGDEPQRCDDAKQRVYSARDRVRSTCGTCADGTTVERAAPVPSR